MERSKGNKDGGMNVMEEERKRKRKSGSEDERDGGWAREMK